MSAAEAHPTSAVAPASTASPRSAAPAAQRCAAHRGLLQELVTAATGVRAHPYVGVGRQRRAGGMCSGVEASCSGWTPVVALLVEQAP